MTWGKAGDDDDDKETYELTELAEPKIEPNFETTGKLAEASNKVNGVVMKYSEPQDARRPTKHCPATTTRRRPARRSIPCRKTRPWWALWP